ncbi:MAG: ABC transporter permease [Candidatus Berkelbacteria bacterium]
MIKLFWSDLKMLFRNRQASFWALMFPLMFTVIFGLFFGKDSTNGTVIIINNSQSVIAKNIETTIVDSKLFAINTSIKNVDEARAAVKKGKAGGAIVIPSGFGDLSTSAPREITVIDDPGNATTNTILLGFLNKFNTQMTYQQNNIRSEAFAIKEEKTNTNKLTYFDFVLAGMFGLALMNASIMGIAIGMNKYREDKILKRIITAPIKTWWFITGEVLSRLVLNFLQITIIYIIGKYVFGAHIYGSVYMIYLVALIGAVMFQLIGFALASIVRTVDAAQGAAMAITIPMMFLGGIFFPIDTLPKWLYSIVQFLPLAPLLRIMRGVILEGASIFADPNNLIIVGAWIVGCLAIASWKFRLNDE